MTAEEWKEFTPYFSAKECGAEMNLDFMHKVFRFRLFLGAEMIVTAGYELTGHAKDSYHKLGRALDFWTHLPTRETMRKIDQIGLFFGAGTYPYTAHHSFHIDDRPPEKYNRWKCSNPGDYIYLMERA